MSNPTRNNRIDHRPGSGPARGVVIAVIIGAGLWAALFGISWLVAQ